MAKANDPHSTPAMKQFHRFKQQYPGCVLFFRMGDFYEMFYEDAELAHKVLGVTLTQRTKGIPMAGVPYHAVDGYLRRMIQAGYRVAVCDQVEDPAQAKGVVKRDVTRVVTPGTVTEETLLEDARENPLAAVQFHGNDKASLAWAELSTGAFSLTTVDEAAVADELARIAPRELLYCETATGETPPRVDALCKRLGAIAALGRPAWQFRTAEAIETLKRQYQVAGLSGFGLDENDPALGAASAVIHYLLETQRADANGRIAHLRPPKRFTREAHLVIDQTSLRSLEVERTMRSESAAGSLLGVLQDCHTAMGKRLLRQWLCYPLCDRQAIEQRQQVVRALVDDSRFERRLSDTLKDVQDVERIAARLSVGRASPRDLVGLGRSAITIETLADLLADRPALSAYHQQINDLTLDIRSLGQQVESACVETPPTHMRDGGLVRDGYDAQLDEYRSLQRDSRSWLAEYQKKLIDETGIPTLKIGYNKVFGYYIETTAVHRDKAPQAWTRRQTLKNAERYVTEELKAYEDKALSAQSKAIAREQQLFAELCEQATQRLDALHRFAQAVAELDVLACFARRAVRRGYVCPTIVEEPVLSIKAGKHPVLDELLGDRFVANDIELGSGVCGSASDREEEASTTPATDRTLALITGPNMAGKSTYIRQAALLTLMAHAGSFVPAEQATIGLCDRIFTRIGSSDELHTGQSTFMVEMTETANICHHATRRSLVILDEIGRGTSTLDGLSLAWAIAEYLASLGPRTLFATHYNELTTLPQTHTNVVNLNVSVREWQDQIVFLHRIVPGATDRSYGIHVAKLAGLPSPVVRRANELLSELSVSHEGSATRPPSEATVKPDTQQLPLFTEFLNHPVIDEIKSLDINTISPLKAFELLREMREKLDDKAQPTKAET
ncbi:MAG: DNA mismatch repair protein MutS [Phycisphaeraceae bacterium]